MLLTIPLCVAFSFFAPLPQSLPAPLKVEPVYQAKPQYFLMKLGRDAPVPVWLVLDGDTLYVDRNANGNLTEKGIGRKAVRCEKDELTFALAANEITGYPTDAIELTVKFVPQEKKWRLEPFVLRTFAPKGQKPRYAMGGPGGWFSDKPTAAASNHVHSQLTMCLRTDLTPVPGQPTSISISTGTLQPDGKLKTYCCILPADRHPVGELVFRPAGPDQKPVTIGFRFDRLGCVCHAHVAVVDVPANVGRGSATLTLSVPDWEYGEVAPAVIEIPIEAMKGD